MQVILAIIVAWILCAILTATDAIPNDPDHWSYHARTDVKIKVLSEANWFRFPYPCKSSFMYKSLHSLNVNAFSQVAVYYRQELSKNTFSLC